VIRFTPRMLYPRYAMDRRLGGPRRRCGPETCYIISFYFVEHSPHRKKFQITVVGLGQTYILRCYVQICSNDEPHFDNIYEVQY
jgi:hypothetical protein